MYTGQTVWCARNSYLNRKSEKNKNMKNFPILCVLIILIVDRVFSSQRYQYIDECHYNDEDQHSYKLKFICAESTNKNFFEDGLKVCKDQYGFDPHNIRKIEFEDCELKQIASNFFTVYSNVTDLNITNLGVESLQPNSFIGAKNLENLRAENNKFTKIPANLFADCENLYFIDFGKNHINYIDSAAFPLKNKLAMLLLDHNDLSEFEANTFERLTHLRFLNLEYNKLTRIPANLFAQNSALEEITLHFNQIIELPVNLFQNLTKLQTINLSNNQIEKIPSFLVNDSVHFLSIDLSMNKIRVVDDFAFAGASNLKNLDLKDNQIKHLSLSNFHQDNYLDSFDISNNQIMELDSFDTLRRLTSLESNHNPIRKIKSNTFAKVVDLEYIYLRNISLTQVEPGAFSTLQKLRLLDLEDNQLITLDANVLPPLPNALKHIFIGDNQLRELNNITAELIPNGRFYGIDSNKFNCSYLDKLKEVLTSEHIVIPYYVLSCNDTNEIVETQSENDQSISPSVEESKVQKND